MFIQLKLDPHNANAVPFSKNLTYFPIDDEATIKVLKCKIHEYVDVPAENQEIRTLTKSFVNDHKVKELCFARGSSIMLYGYDGDLWKYRQQSDAHFICFLQVFTNEVSLRQQEMELQRLTDIAKSSKTVSPAKSLASSVTLIPDSDMESLDNDSGSTSEGSSSGDSNRSKLSIDNKKRKCNIERIEDHKRLKASPGLDKLSSTLCKYLEEFPKSQKNVERSYSKGISSDDSENSNSSEDNRENNKHIERNIDHDKLKDTSGSNNNKNTDTSQMNSGEIKHKLPANQQTRHADNVYCKSPTTSTMDNTAIPCETVEKSQKTLCDGRAMNTQRKGDITGILSTTTDICHPCSIINPLYRQFTLIISKNAQDINKAQCDNLLEWFFDRFRTSDNSFQLQFLNHAAVTHYEGKLWIACMNRETCEWVSSNISQYPHHSYNVEPLNSGSHLCEVVVPNVVSRENNLLDIFELLEKQNPNLCTMKWIVSNRRILKTDDKDYNNLAVSAMCANELLNICVDSKTKKFLDGVDQKLKYCFWEIVFKFLNV